MRVLVIGGNGFVGSHVQDALLPKGHSVRVLDRVPERYRAPLPGVDNRTGSCADPSVLAEAMAGVDAVMYLAATSVPSTSSVDVASDVESNLLPMVNTLDAMVRAGVERIVFLSSGGTVYGVTEQSLVSENAPTDPICSYGVVKLASEKYLGMYRHLYGIRPAILRPSNVFGPREGHTGVQGFIGTALMRVLRGEPIEIWGDGSVVRDYLYVDDLARAMLLAVEASVIGPVNIGSGEGRSLLQVIETLSAVTGGKPEVRFLGPRAFDVPRLALAIDRARDVLGWVPAVRFADGVAKYWQWLCRHVV
ncbi:MAG: NAD-dependent epimerase [Actinobacteria bacterium RBG_16_64_13]|nr:MAG: NAD-dependent epimerase [Actinobacteria bacterium RBG_16_64_13]